MPLILPRRGLTRRPRGPFAFPGNNPGVDPSYGLVFSAVPIGANFVSLLQGAKPGTVTAPSVAPAAAIIATGPAVRFPTNAADVFSRVTHSGNPSTNFLSFTIAAIFTGTAFTGTQVLFGNDSSGNGVFVFVNGSGVLQLSYWGGASKSSGLTLIAGIPYFIVISANGTTNADFFVLRMDTGSVATASTTGSTPNAPNGTFTIGNGPGGGSTSNSAISAVAFSGAYNAPAVVRKWSSDPWGLWYPR